MDFYKSFLDKFKRYYWEFGNWSLCVWQNMGRDSACSTSWDIVAVYCCSCAYSITVLRLFLWLAYSFFCVSLYIGQAMNIWFLLIVWVEQDLSIFSNLYICKNKTVFSIKKQNLFKNKTKKHKGGRLMLIL